MAEPPAISAAGPRQPRHLRSQATRAAGERQLRDLPRRLHAQRPRLVRRQAQRVERRRQPRRQRPELSWNCGVEGPTDDPAIERLRARQIRNFLCLDLLSLGAPMLLMGDEVRRTQDGNDNAYGHDDRRAVRLDRGRPACRRPAVHQGLDRPASPPVVGPRGATERMSLLEILAEGSDRMERGPRRCPRCRAGLPERGPARCGRCRTLEVIFNAYWEALDFELPPLGDEAGSWRRIVDTSLDAPDDIVLNRGPPVEVADGGYRVGPRSGGRAGGASRDRPIHAREVEVTDAERRR